MQFEKVIRSPFIIEPLKWLGKNSLTILCMHLIELSIIPWKSLFKVVGFATHVFIPILLLKLIWSIGWTTIINTTGIQCVFKKR